MKRVYVFFLLFVLCAGSNLRAEPQILRSGRKDLSTVIERVSHSLPVLPFALLDTEEPGETFPPARHGGPDGHRRVAWVVPQDIPFSIFYRFQYGSGDEKQPRYLLFHELIFYD